MRSPRRPAARGDQRVGEEHRPNAAKVLAALGCYGVAEGVETPAVLARLTELSCDLAQGYLVARPMPVEGLSDFIGAQRRPRHPASFPVSSSASR